MTLWGTANQKTTVSLLTAVKPQILWPELFYIYNNIKIKHYYNLNLWKEWQNLGGILVVETELNQIGRIIVDCTNLL